MSHASERAELLAEGMQLRRTHEELQRKRPVNLAEQARCQSKLGEYAQKVKAYRLRVAQRHVKDLV